MKVLKDHLPVNFYKRKEKAFIIVRIVETNYFPQRLNSIAALVGRHSVKLYQGPLKQRLKDKGAKYYDEPYLRFKGTKYEQETFFVKDPNENILEIKTLTANPE